MSNEGRKKLTFDGFLMGLGEEGVKDSEGVFTVAARQTVERLREQYSVDLGLGYTEILQGFQELGAEWVEIASKRSGSVVFSARFPGEAPQLQSVLEQPLSILASENCLQSGTGLILLQHDEDQVFWSIGDGRNFQDWQFILRDGCFQPSTEGGLRRPILSGHQVGKKWLQFHLHSQRPLAIFADDSSKRWENTKLSEDFAHRLAFYGCPLVFKRRNLQCPLPGRLVPTDYWSRSPAGGMGYNWIPLAFHYVAAHKGSTHYFCSEPFTGVIANKVEINGEMVSGYGASSKPDFVRMTGSGDGVCTVPFKRSWWHRSSNLTIGGFEAVNSRIKNPRLEPPLFRDHPRGKPLKCSRLHMLSTALKGPSTLVFVKHGVVLGARHEELGAPGSLCLVGLEDLTTDLSRRAVRQNDRYRRLVSQLDREITGFYRDTRKILGF